MYRKEQKGTIGRNGVECTGRDEVYRKERSGQEGTEEVARMRCMAMECPEYGGEGT